MPRKVDNEYPCVYCFAVCTYAVEAPKYQAMFGLENVMKGKLSMAWLSKKGIVTAKAMKLCCNCFTTYIVNQLVDLCPRPYKAEKGVKNFWCYCCGTLHIGESVFRFSKSHQICISCYDRVQRHKATCRKIFKACSLPLSNITSVLSAHYIPPGEGRLLPFECSECQKAIQAGNVAIVGKNKTPYCMMHFEQKFPTTAIPGKSAEEEESYPPDFYSERIDESPHSIQLENMNEIQLDFDTLAEAACNAQHVPQTQMPYIGTSLLVGDSQNGMIPRAGVLDVLGGMIEGYEAYLTTSALVETVQLF